MSSPGYFQISLTIGRHALFPHPAIGNPEADFLLLDQGVPGELFSEKAAMQEKGRRKGSIDTGTNTI